MTTLLILSLFWFVTFMLWYVVEVPRRTAPLWLVVTFCFTIFTAWITTQIALDFAGLLSE